MATRSVGALGLVFFLAGTFLSEGQEQRFKIGGGAGFAVLYNPDANLGRTSVVGGGLGFRFNDNFSLETGLTFAFADRLFDENDDPVEELRALPAYRFEADQYDIDGTLYFHLGRREPFHAFLFAGGGLERRDVMRTDIEFTLNDNGIVIDRQEEIVFTDSRYEPQAHFGGGFDLYVLYNVAARVEFRVRVPQTTANWSRAFFFGAAYYW